MPKKLKTPGDRVRYLLDTHWGGHQSGMAKAVGCAQATLSQIASGRKEPGKHLLTMIANLDDIDSNWLFHGTGDPVVSAAERAPVQLPVLTKPLGRGSDPRKVRSDSRRAAPIEYSESCYWLRLQRGEPIVKDLAMGVWPGDLVLVETDQRRFPAVERMFEHLCIVKIEDELRLGMVGYTEASIDEGPARLEADTFENWLGEGKIYEEYTFGEDGVLKPHSLRRYQIRNGKKCFVTEHQLDPKLHPITGADIAGICVLSLRLWNN